MHKNLCENTKTGGGEIMNKKIIGLVALVFAVVITGFSVSGTYAKYTSTFNATDKARVAKFDVGTLKEANMFSDSYYADEDKKDVDAEGEKVVAPGTIGAYTFAFDTSSADIETNYTITPTITFAVKGKGYGDSTYLKDGEANPFKFYVVSQSFDQEGDALRQALEAAKGSGAVSIQAGDNVGDKLTAAVKTALGENKVYAANTKLTTPVTIIWEWEFKEDDVADNQKEANEYEYTFGIKAVVAQSNEAATE